MQSLRDIKRRIKSVKNIAQITKAMEVVSMNKMRKSQYYALSSRPYARASLDMLKNILFFHKNIHIPVLLKKRIITHAVVIVVTADKGLVGGFNDAILKKTDIWLQEKREKDISCSVIAVGKKAQEYFARQKIDTIKNFIQYGDYTEYGEIKPIADMVISGFETGQWDSVDIIYTHFKTTLKQEQKLRTIVPAQVESLEEIVKEITPEYGKFSNSKDTESYNYSYTFEPSPQSILNSLVANVLKTALYHMMLESNASEHSARMVTMKSASDNAADVRDRLTTEMNKARQAGITSEISEIIAGAEAL